MILNVSAANAVVGKLISFLENVGVIGANIIIGILTLGAYVVNGNAALTVLNLGIEGVGGNSVVMLFPSA